MIVDPLSEEEDEEDEFHYDMDDDTHRFVLVKSD